MNKYYATWHYGDDYHAATVHAEDMMEALIKVVELVRDTNPDEEPDSFAIRRQTWRD